MDSLAAAAADLVLGAACVSCDRPGLALCAGCRRELTGLPFRTWPDPCPAGLPAVWALAAYDGVARAALVAHKEHAVLSLARPLGQALAVAVLGLLASYAVGVGSVRLVPVPSDAATVRTRGHDPLLRIAAEACRALGRAGVEARVVQLLRQRRRLADQAGLGATERAANVAAAFKAGKPRVRGSVGLEPCVVVDDIVTTGATALEASRALSQAGHAVLGVSVVAATQRQAGRAARQTSAEARAGALRPIS